MVEDLTFFLSTAGSSIVVRIDGDQGQAESEQPAEEMRRLHAGFDPAPRARRPPPLSPAAARDAGSRLAALLGAPPMRSIFDRAVGTATAAKRTLRLRISFNSQPTARWLQDLPWELLYDPSFKFLALDARFSIVRDLETPLPKGATVSKNPLRCLFAGATPHGIAPVSTLLEMKAIEPALQEIQGLDWKADLHTKLRQLRASLVSRPCRALHFMGHGFWEPDSPAGLILEDDHGQAARASSEDLALILKDVGLSLVTLNACHSATNGQWVDGAAFRGVAQSLIQAGIPCVVAMNDRIEDRAAVDFAKVFYQRLVERATVDAAMTEARLALTKHGPLTWAIPSLFLQSNDGVVFAAEETSRLTSDHPGNAERPGGTDRGAISVDELSGEENVLIGNRADGLPGRASREGILAIGKLTGNKNQIIGIEGRASGGKPQ